MNFYSRGKKRGFTILELIITFGIFAFLAGLLLLILNPTKRFSEVRDIERKRAVNTLLDIVSSCVLRHNGVLPQRLSILEDNKAYILGHSKSGCDSVCNVAETKGACLDLSKADCEEGKTIVPDYITSLPVDPNRGKWDEGKTGYYIRKTAARQFLVGSCDPENSEISGFGEY